MTERQDEIEQLLRSLQERAKELNCLYKIEELLSTPYSSMEEIYYKIIGEIPAGWQYPENCICRINVEGVTYQSVDFKETQWHMCSSITVLDEVIGKIEVFYTQVFPPADEGPFLKEERKLIDTIAERLGHTIFHRRHRAVLKRVEASRGGGDRVHKSDWRVILDMLRTTDQNLFIVISRKMANYLLWNGFDEAEKLLQDFTLEPQNGLFDSFDDANRPLPKQNLNRILHFSHETFAVAERYLSDEEILNEIRKWIQEDKSNQLLRVLGDYRAAMPDIIEALARYDRLSPSLAPTIDKGLRVSLIRHFFFESPDFINVAKDFIEVGRFYDLVQRIIYPVGSHGKLGGKSAGLFLASEIVHKSAEYTGELKSLKTPKSWYIASDAVINFMHSNNLEEIIEQKYKDIELVRLEYPQIVQIFKNSYFPPEILRGLSMALDDFGDRPLIVRSSSLLEDTLGTAFSGKYKSLFLANQGTREERLEALTDAIAEVYASTFGPDPIQYRSERSLLDYYEEMGIMIQEVVGMRVGPYYFPFCGGVAFSNNEFRWSSRIKRKDGLIRMVPGLGTRAVDRLSDDYPILLAPGQPSLRVNVTVEEKIRYAPKMIDVINMETNTFETVEIETLLREHGHEIRNLQNMVSLYRENDIQQPAGSFIDTEKEDLIVTFEGLIANTDFVAQISQILTTLQNTMKHPVDIEFAHDGTDLYLLQCRPQSFSADNVASPIPKDVAQDRIIFTANRYVSNGRIPDITHIVYVDPDQYAALGSVEELNAVGRIVGRLNKLLPKRQFILMGPGRWGSRGDIKLGVNVTYSDFSNTAALIEIARKKGSYVPELSFGTHFFQDLVESSIRYLPLYPDDDGVLFNETFLSRSSNILPEILPDFADYSDVIRVIDVPKSAGGMQMRILMNADLCEAIGMLTHPSSDQTSEPGSSAEAVLPISSDDHWRWRLSMAGKMALQLDPELFGVKEFYVFGSAKNATAGPGSDIDIMIHFTGNDTQRRELLLWLEGWSLCLAELNYLRTGYRSDGLLDIHLITDEDIARRTSFAVKIGAVTDAARELPMKSREAGGT